MIYSDPEFLLFFVITILAYSICKTQKQKLLVLVASSLFFYAWAGVGDTLIFLFILVVAWGASWIAVRRPQYRKSAVVIGVTTMAVHLVFWKYAPWLAGEIQKLSPSFFGGKPLRLPLPVGISFFTLQGIAYLVDLYKGEAGFIDFTEFVAFKSFFPQLVAGPIVRAKELMPQIRHLRRATSEEVHEGLQLFCIGFAKKVMFADRCGIYSDMVFNDTASYDRSTLLFGLLSYAVQIWADFSGYTDMGRGVALFFGIRLPENFLAPYLSRSPSEFWRRWHITLSRWIRDYIYIPLGGSKGSFLRVTLVAVVTMAISGIWHGANWTFVAWGLYHAALLFIARLADKIRGESKAPVSFWISWPPTFIAVIFGWSFFRSNDLSSWSKFAEGLYLNVGNHKAMPMTVVAALMFCALHHVVFYYSFESARFPVLAWMANKRDMIFKPWNWSALQARFFAIALGTITFLFFYACVAYRLKDGARPFIYFQF